MADNEILSRQHISRCVVHACNGVSLVVETKSEMDSACLTMAD